MTDEEMTEEYLEKKSEEYVPNIKWHDFSSEDLREEMKLCYRAGMKDGYQEGLKAKINATTISDCPIKDEWHRLGKNPNDLPDEDVPVLCVRGGNIYVAWYSNNEWRGRRWEQVKKPYAWKEIELPKEEE